MVMLRTRKDLRKYQARAAMRIVQQKRIGLFVDMSLGKTAITLTAIRNLIDQNKLPNGALVVAPLNVTKDTWQAEAQLWSHLKDLRFVLIEGSPGKRKKLLQEKADVKIISYTLLPWISTLIRRHKKNKRLKKDRPAWLPDLLALDESEHVKGRGAWFKAIRYHLMPWMPYRIIQTGTPAAHSLMDLWAQIFVLDRGARLGTAFDRFRKRFFRQNDYQGYQYVPRDGAEQRIYTLLKDSVVRLDGADWLELPQIIEDVVPVELPTRAMQLYRKHEREMFIRLDNLREVEAVNAAVLSNQCWQLANGAIYDNPDTRDSWSEIHTAKLDALRRLLEEAVGNPVIVAYWFRHDRARLQAAHPTATFMNKNNIKETVTAWNAGKIPLLFINPQSGAHGLNMQYGGHLIIWFSQIWSGGRHDQLIARLRRPDQRSPHIISRYITARHTVDEVIRETRTRRLRGQAALLQALKDYRRRKQQ